MIFLTMLILPAASSEAAADLEKYLDCLTDKKVDIVFVFDTSGSMGGEINELSAVVRDFATDLGAFRIDYRLGLVEFRDFPITCGERTKISCGNPGDFAYKVKDNGTLTAEVNTFSSWLKELKAGGGGTGGPEAVLAALRHAGGDLLWRSDAEKVIILLTDAGPHPDGDCCNAEGDTLEGTIFGLTGQGARVHVIGSEDAALRRIAGDTGGQFFKIRSGLSLKPLLKEITGAMSCSFRVEAETTCLDGTLEAKVRLVGKDVIPFVAGQTEAWMYLDQAGNKSRYNLSYDQTAGAYWAKVPDICGPVELAVYGRVGERSAVQTVQVECGTCGAAAEQGASNQPPEMVGLTAEPASPQETGAVVTWTAEASDPDGDQIFYRFFIDDKPTIDWTEKKRWTWTPNNAGSYRIEAQVRDGKHAGPNGLDDRKSASFTIAELKPTEPQNKPPIINDLVAAQDRETAIAWTAEANDQENDPILYRFLLNNDTMNDWITDNKWTLNTTEADVGNNTIEVQIRDGKHAGSNGYDDTKSVRFMLSSMKLMVQRWNKTLEGFEAYSVQLTSDGGYIIAGLTDSIPFDVLLIKTDSGGNKLWERTFGGSDDDQAHSVQQTSDEGYIIAGDTASYGAGGKNWLSDALGSLGMLNNPDVWLIKTDFNGNKQWDRTFGGSGNDAANSVQQTSDGGYIIAGRTGWDVWLIKTDSSGNALWDNTFGGSAYDEAYSVQQTSDGGYIITGETQSYGAGTADIWLIKTDSSGNEEWNRTFGGSDYDQASSVQQTNDGGYIIAGYSGSYGAGSTDAWLIKTDPDGNRIWDRTFGGSDADFAWSVQQTSDRGYIVAGSTNGPGDFNTWLIKTDSLGNEEWKKVIIANYNDVNSVRQTSDMGYIIAGQWSTGKDSGILLIKTDANGNV